MKITFLGSGGGRYSTISQKRMTGGFRIDNLCGKNYHIDPGPGALIRTYQFNLNPLDVDALFVSHSHIDHYNDAEILIESMINRGSKNDKVVIGSESVLKGFKKWGPSISKYHLSKLNKAVLKENKILKINGVKFKGTKTLHNDPTGVGFQITYGDFKLSYTSDTNYFDELASYHEGSDILIANIGRPKNDFIQGHLCSHDLVDLIGEVRPKLAVMNHFGLKMISANPDSEAREISKKTDTTVIAAYDGLSLDIDFKNLK